MRTINHPDYPEQLYYLDEIAQQRIDQEKEKKSFLRRIVSEAFTTPTALCSNCGRVMTKRWMNQLGGPSEALYLVCEDCHRFVDCEVSRD